MANFRSLTWETDYQHDRRAHRHRCLSCNRIINAGEPVLMAKVADRKTVALHILCAAKVVFTAAQANDGTEWTYRRLVTEQAREHYRKLGIPFAEAA